TVVSFSTSVVVCGGSAIAKVMICNVRHWSRRQRPGVNCTVRYGTTPVSSRCSHFSNYDYLDPRLLLGLGNSWSRRPGRDRWVRSSKPLARIGPPHPCWHRGTAPEGSRGLDLAPGGCHIRSCPSLAQ